MGKAFAGGLLVVGLLAVMALWGLLYAAVGSVMWNWFVAPTFHTVRLSALQAFGMVLTFGVLYPRSGESSKDNGDDGGRKLFGYTVAPLFILGLGAILHYGFGV